MSNDPIKALNDKIIRLAEYMIECDSEVRVLLYGLAIAVLEAGVITPEQHAAGVAKAEAMAALAKKEADKTLAAESASMLDKLKPSRQ